MASKQLGKLRQWAGEVMSSREKTQSSSEFAALEQDMETRKRGIDILHTASRDYLEHISQKRQSDALPGEEPMMQTEALGVVMIRHGEDLGDASALGRSLTSLGRARCQIAVIQNVYAVTLTGTFLAYLEHARAGLDDFAAQRKKLESRRLAYDAATSKAEKAYKKEKDKKEAEEELAKANARYEEMSDDVRARMEAIREGEVEHQRELENFLQLETQFVEQYLEVLKGVKSDWPQPDTYADLRRPTSSFTAPHSFSRTSTRSTDSKDSEAKQAPPVSSRFGSQRSRRSVLSASSNKSGSVHSINQHEPSGESEVDTPRSRSSSRLSRRKSTRSSRRQSRSGSVTTIGAVTAENTADDATSVQSISKHKKTSSGVASWVGDAMSNVMSRNKSRNTDVDNFATLGDEDDEKSGTRPKHSRRLSNRSTKSNGSDDGKGRSRTGGSAESGSGKGGKKVVKALYDFSGSSDELSFKAGDEIVVVNEVLDDWWLGELGGRKGLFPSNYAVFIKTVDNPSGASTKFKNTSNSSILALARGSSKLSSEDDESRRTLVEPSESELSMTEDEHDGDSVDGLHPFDDSHRSSALPSGMVVPLGERDSNVADVPYGNESLIGNSEFNKKLSSSLAKLDMKRPSRATGPTINNSSTSPSPSPVRRIPPPPPPRRQTSSAVSNVPPPPLPLRNLPVPSRTHSSNGALQSLSPPPPAPLLDRKAHSDTSSPFESQSELSFDAVATTVTMGSLTAERQTPACGSCECDEFVEDPFRGHGLCAKCTHAHT